MQEKIDFLWNDLRVVGHETWSVMGKKCSFELDPTEYRLDDLGAIIKKSEQGQETEFGWTIDHIFPVSRGGTDHLKNLQLLHWRNNMLKGDDFPTFNWDTKINWDGSVPKNSQDIRPGATITDALRDQLKTIYPYHNI